MGMAEIISLGGRGPRLFVEMRAAIHFASRGFVMLRLAVLIVFWFTASITILTCAATQASAQNVAVRNLPAAQNLQADANQVRDRKIPILLFFDRRDCPYCERALREYLLPMSREEPTRDAAPYRQIEIEADDPVTDFSGKPATHRALAERYRVRVSPTIVMVDGEGQPLAPPLIGLNSADFYGAYLSDAIETATKRLRSR